MAAIKRIALFAYPDGFYVNQLLGLKRGFESLGVEAHAGWPSLDGPVLESFTDNFKPDAIFEIDRFRDQISDFDGKILHVAWVQNHQAYGRRVHEKATGSDLVYTVFDLAQFGFPEATAAKARRLLLAVDPETFFPGRGEPEFDLSLIGNIYGPLSEEALDAELRADGKPFCRLRDMIDAYKAMNFRHTDFTVKKIDDFIRLFYLNHGYIVRDDQVPSLIRFVFDEYMIRLEDRKKIAEAMLRVSPRIAFFGGDNWRKWPAFEPHYQRFLTRASDLAAAYRASRITVHNSAVTMHFRPLESMACGRPVLVNRTPLDNTPDGIEFYFEPWRHYIPFDLENFEETAAEALANPARLTEIGEQGSKRALEGHTWRHRARQILLDLARF